LELIFEPKWNHIRTKTEIGFLFPFMLATETGIFELVLKNKTRPRG
jgi:hypothetical protein